MPEVSAPSRLKRGPVAKPESNTSLLAVRVPPPLRESFTKARGQTSETDAVREALRMYIESKQPGAE